MDPVIYSGISTKETNENHSAPSSTPARLNCGTVMAYCNLHCIPRMFYWGDLCGSGPFNFYITIHWNVHHRWCELYVMYVYRKSGILVSLAVVDILLPTCHMRWNASWQEERYFSLWFVFEWERNGIFGALFCGFRAVWGIHFWLQLHAITVAFLSSYNLLKFMWFSLFAVVIHLNGTHF